jgi:hypothetical protein
VESMQFWLCQGVIDRHLVNPGDAKMLILNYNAGSEGVARLLHRLNLAWALAMDRIPRRSAGLRTIDLTSKEVESPWLLHNCELVDQ